MAHFFARISPSNLVPPFRWCPLFEGFIPFFSCNVPSSFLEFSFRVSGGICLCCEGPHPLSLAFGFFKDHFFSTCFSHFRFILRCSYSLMEFQPEVDLDFSLDMFKTTFIHLVHLLASGLSGMVFEHL